LKTLNAYILGLDVGIASVGWCTLTQDRIIDLGVRCFDKAENEKGESKGVEWRTKKTQRRRLKRRAQRLLRLRRLLALHNLIRTPDADFCKVSAEPDGLSPWEIRAQGLDRLLTGPEFAKATYHIVKHRGFLSTRKSELKDEKKETGKLSAGVSRTRELLNKGNWRTPGELAARDPEFSEAKRNKNGTYKNTFDRQLLLDELKLLFTAQRALNSSFASAELEDRVLEIFSHQLPALTVDKMLNLIGKCTFEKNEHRAPKSSWTAERFVWMTKLNNLRISEHGLRRELSLEERAALINLPYDQKEVKYKSLRTKLKKHTEFPDHARFVGLSYRADDRDPESASFVQLRGWHTLESAIEKACGKGTWLELSNNHAKLDRIAFALTVCKTDDEIRQALAVENLSQAALEALLEISFTNFVHLSLKALERIVPLMEQGLRYDKACAQSGYNHSKQDASAKNRFLPTIPRHDIRNPVVYRALNQTRKVINAIVRKYGSPAAVHIELARDLSKPFDERIKIQRAQQKFQQDKERAKSDFAEKFDREPRAKNQDLLKYRLYEEQQCKCAYSLIELDLARLFDDGYVEIDHILPYSRSFDDSQNNKVLVLVVENRNKKNQTPFEYLSALHNEERWDKFEKWVLSNRAFRAAKRERLLRRSFNERDSEEFKERNLSDTRYLGRYLKSFIETHLAIVGDKKDENVLCVNGQFTAFLRARWGLIKQREKGDKHHAMDATVVASATRSLVKRVSDFSKYGKLIQRQDGLFVSRATGEVLDANEAAEAGARFPYPWDRFRDELLARLDEHPIEKLTPLQLISYTPDDLKQSKALFVSRAPKRRNRGPAHKDTIRSIKRLSDGVSTVRTPIQNLTLKSFEQLVAAEDPRNKPLYDAIRERLEQFNGDGKKAFARPLFKPNKAGNASAAVVKTVKLQTIQKGGVLVRKGIADQESMIRVDTFKKADKYYSIPIYQSDRASANLPSKLVVAGKPRDEWPEVDDTYQFIFSLFHNDVVKLINKKGEVFFGYFAGLDVATGAIHIMLHDRNPDFPGSKDGVFRSLGVRTATAIEKFHVDPLGTLFKVKKENRHSLA
jgi:CRISPR-associated endonuclease Csn1